jgi:hypothetical protein
MFVGRRFHRILTIQPSYDSLACCGSKQSLSDLWNKLVSKLCIWYQPHDSHMPLKGWNSSASCEETRSSLQSRSHASHSQQIPAAKWNQKINGRWTKQKKRAKLTTKSNLRTVMSAACGSTDACVAWLGSAVRTTKLQPNMNGPL